MKAITFICLLLCAAPASAIEKRYSGACDGGVTDSEGDRIECDCNERPYCDDTEGGGEYCYCEYDQYCADVACGGPGATSQSFAHALTLARGRPRTAGRAGGE